MKAVFIIVFAIFYLPALASDSIPPKKNNYKTKLVTMEGEIYNGFLSHLDDSIVYISDVPIIYGQPDLRNTNRFSYTDITEINLKRRGSAGRGILYGSLAGGLIGALVGLATYKEPDCPPGSWICIDFGPGFSAFGGGTIGAFGGGLIGGFIGANAKKTFTIGGKREKFDTMKMSVLEWAYGTK